jgi:hypothetical protein
METHYLSKWHLVSIYRALKETQQAIKTGNPGVILAPRIDEQLKALETELPELKGADND